MKTYEGTRRQDGCRVVVWEEDGKGRELSRRLDLRQHSHTGFEWGYLGSGPAQLALALCADVLGDNSRALQVYQAFKRRVVSALAGDSWSLTEEQIRSTINAIESDRPALGGEERVPGR